MVLKIQVLSTDYSVNEISRGDTLQIIAVRYYNSDEEQYVQMLYDANKDTLISKNLIMIGMLLKVPLLEP